MNALNSSTHLPRLAAAAILGAFAVISATPLRAGDTTGSDDVRQRVVSYGDLNLSNPRGASALYSRIASAANEVCQVSDLNSRDLGMRESAQSCVRKAISGAVVKIGRKELLVIYNAKNPVPLGFPVAATQAH